MYVVRYAEEDPDVALLSVSSFQKALKDPNQLVRASALRVLTGVRIPAIVPIMLISLKQASKFCNRNLFATNFFYFTSPVNFNLMNTGHPLQAATDMSPYVRKVAAHALPKVYDMAPTEEEAILDIMEKLLCDRTHVGNRFSLFSVFSSLRFS